tara:strand:- start:316 stop:582 length:267 start_codon:yes stop_codon:yes gene_type:complete
MEKLKQGQEIYYKDWQNNDRLIPAYVLRCKRVWCTVAILKGKSLNDWETWEVEIEDCIPTNDFSIGKRHEFFGHMIEWKNGVKIKHGI